MLNSDLAVEFALAHGGETVFEQQFGIVRQIQVNESKLFLDRCGVYYHIDCNNKTSMIENAVAECLTKFAINKQKILFVGVGNAKYISDALGELVLDKLPQANSHIAKIKPQGARETGIETKEMILAVKRIVKPTLVVAIDSLATSNLQSIGKSIQITNVGFTPGSGVGNSRKILSEKTLGVPIIAIGVPLVATIKCDDTTRIVTPIDIEDIATNLSNAIANGIGQVILK